MTARPMIRLYSFLVSIAALCACGASGNNETPSPPDPPLTPIYEVQGNGPVSPFDGQSVTVVGVVTGDFQNDDDDVQSSLDGFYLQEEMPDSDLTTSDGVFVYDGNSPAVDVTVGDRVRIIGNVAEYFGETQITPTAVEITGSGVIAPTVVTLPLAAVVTNSDGQVIGDYERYEGMLLRFSQPLTVSDLFNLERYGEVQLSHGGRVYTFTNSNTPDIDGYTLHRERIAASRFLLDDGLRTRMTAPIRYLTAGNTADFSIRVGDKISELTGNLRYSRGSGSAGTETYRLVPVVEPLFASTGPRPGAPTVNGTITVASFNLRNFFTTIDTGQRVCGPLGDGSCRGADSSDELKRQLTKIAAALTMLDADIVSLNELENNRDASLQSIVDRLNAIAGGSAYAFVNTGTIGNDSIKTGFIYKPGSVSLRGAFSILDSSIDARFNDRRNRPALAQTFSLNSNGAVLTVVVNHLKSKGSSCDSDGDPDIGDGQSNCNQTRTKAAAAIADWLALDPTASGDPDYLIIGDLNAHGQEDPLTALKSAGFVNLVETSGGEPAYSFIFDGQSGALDHALASPSLVPQVVAAIDWHVNADEPAVRDYNLESGRDPSLFDADSPYRASDHDPIIVGLDLSP